MPTQELISPQLADEIRQLMASYPKPKSAILMALHRVQEELGWVPDAAQAQLGEIFSMPAEDVKSLVTFYYMYYRQPMGKYVLKVCRSISCYLCGAPKLIAHLEEKLGVKLGETTPDGQFSLVGAECLAACTGAPCLQVNDRFFENASDERVDDLLARLKTGSHDQYPANKPSWKPEG